eukprot:m.26835 g.26835  ORF g.26835 m.26835 type:complete len:517 (-) comp10135_c0_seq1:110-1660(-)
MGCGASTQLDTADIKAKPDSFQHNSPHAQQHSSSTPLSGWPGITPRSIHHHDDNGACNVEVKHSHISQSVSAVTTISEQSQSSPSAAKSIQLSLEHADGVLPMQHPTSSLEKTKWNIGLILGGPNSEKGLLLHRLGHITNLPIIVLSVEQLLFESFSEQAGSTAMRDIIDYAINNYDVLGMKSLLELLEKRLDDLDISPDTLVLFDMLPNLRSFAKSPLLRNACKYLSMFERQTQPFRFAIHLESRSTSSSKPVDALPEEADVRNLQKRSQLHQTNAFPFLKYFKDGKRLIALCNPEDGGSLQGLLRRRQLLISWIQRYMRAESEAAINHQRVPAREVDEENEPRSRILLTASQSSTEQQHSLDKLNSTATVDSYDTVVCVGPADLLQAFAKALDICISHDSHQDALSMLHSCTVEALPETLHIILQTRPQNRISFLDLLGPAPQTMKAVNSDKGRLWYREQGTLSVGNKDIDTTEADVHAYRIQHILVLVLKPSWSAEAAILSGILTALITSSIP